MVVEIRDITAEDVRRSTRVVRESFRTVADELKLNPDNCPTHPAFVTASSMEALRARDARFLGAFVEGEQVGFVAIEPAADGVFYIERLAVLPEHRHHGLGRRLMEAALALIHQRGGRRVSVALIDENTVLKRWYIDLGFIEVRTQRFEHLPFTVCFMERAIEPAPTDSGTD